MRVEFEFNEKALNDRGYSIAQAKYAVHELFVAEGLRCVRDDEILAFADRGGNDDYSSMWLNITKLINSSWFIPCAAACRWYDEEDVEGRSGRYSFASVEIEKTL